jgi:hypothetical protein
MTTIHTIPSTIDSTGTTDVTDKLNAWIAGVPKDSVAQLREGAKYRVDKVALFNLKEDLHFKGNGAQFIVKTDGREYVDPRTRCHIKVNLCKNTEIEGVEIAGPHAGAGTAESAYVAELEAQHGVWVNGGSYLKIHHLNIHHVYGDWIYVAGISGATPQNVDIYANNCNRNGRQGISICRGNNIRVYANTLDNCRRTMFDLEPNALSWDIGNVYITNNCIGAHRLNFVSSAGRGTVHDIYVDDNMLHSTMQIYVNPSPEMRRGPFFVRRNESDKLYGTPSGTVATFYDCDGVYLLNNIQPGDNRMTAFGRFFNCTQTVDSGNILH